MRATDGSSLNHSDFLGVSPCTAVQLETSTLDIKYLRFESDFYMKLYHSHD